MSQGKFEGDVDAEVLPTELALAELITLSNKGKAEDPANSWPIALLSSTYKLLASVMTD